MKIRDPYIFAGLLLAVIILISTIAGGIGLLSGLSAIGQVVIADSALAVVGIVLLVLLGWWEKAGYTGAIQKRDLPLFFLPFIVALLSLTSGIVVTAPTRIIAFALFALLIGFTEETFFRGLMLTGLLPTGVYRAVIHLVHSFCGTAPVKFSYRIMEPSVYPCGYGCCIWNWYYVCRTSYTGQGASGR